MLGKGFFDDIVSHNLLFESRRYVKSEKKGGVNETGVRFHQTEKTGGPYYYRYQLNGQRKEIPLQTDNKEEAEKKAKALVPITQAKSIEVVAAHVSQARGFEMQTQKLLLSEAWNVYSQHPDRAMPHTVSEQLAYQSTFFEFVNFVSNSLLPAEIRQSNSKTFLPKYLPVQTVHEVTPQIAEAYSAFLKTKSLAVDTHNRKIKRVWKVFDVLKDYYAHGNPFHAKSLLRSEREEQGTVVRRLAFTREEEQTLIRELNNPKRKLINKEEIRIIYHIGMYTGQRLKDCVLMQWQNIDLDRKRIFVKQFKTGKEVSIPLAPELSDALHEALTWKMDLYVCPKSAARYNQTNEQGKNVGNNLIDIDVLRVIRWIGLEPSVKVPTRKKKMTVYGFHSLRHSFASFCAEAGVPKAVLLSILGTESEIADKYYTHVGEAAQQQAIAAVSASMKGLTAQERIHTALRLLEAPSPTQELWEQVRSILRD